VGLITITGAQPEIQVVNVALSFGESSYETAVSEFERYSSGEVVSDDVVRRALTGYIRAGYGLLHEWRRPNHPCDTMR
jgi:hypothetical protein